MPLNTAPNLVAPDDFYEQLVEMHRGLDAHASARINARLILLLANHIGDAEVLAEAIAAARANVGDANPTAPGAPVRGDGVA